MSLYLNKAKAQISFSIPNIDILQRHEGMESRPPAGSDILAPFGAEIKTIPVPEKEPHEGFAGV